MVIIVLQGAGTFWYMAIWVVGGTMQSFEPEKINVGRVTCIAAVVAEGLVSAAAKLNTARSEGSFALAAKKLQPPPIEWPPIPTLGLMRWYKKKFASFPAVNKADAMKRKSVPNEA